MLARSTASMPSWMHCFRKVRRATARFGCGPLSFRGPCCASRLFTYDLIWLLMYSTGLISELYTGSFMMITPLGLSTRWTGALSMMTKLGWSSVTFKRRKLEMSSFTVGLSISENSIPRLWIAMMAGSHVSHARVGYHRNTAYSCRRPSFRSKTPQIEAGLIHTDNTYYVRLRACSERPLNRSQNSILVFFVSSEFLLSGW